MNKPTNHLALLIVYESNDTLQFALNGLLLSSNST